MSTYFSRPDREEFGLCSHAMSVSEIIDFDDFSDIEIKKIAGYRKENNYELIIEMERIHLGFKFRGYVKGFTDEIEIFKFKRPDKLLVNNWQSWGPSKVIEKDFRLDFPDDLIQKFGFSASIMPELYFDNLISDYYIASEHFLVGGLSSKVAHPYFQLDENEVSVKLRYFGIRFEQWQEIEPVVILFDDTDKVLPYYADLVAKENRVALSGKRLVGWSSWYQYFLDFDYEKMCTELENTRRRGYDVFQIDDAWEVDIGDWTPNSKFPSLEEVAAKIKEYGYVPGIWLAPFSVSEKSTLFKEHPDWLVRGEDGNPRVAYENWNKRIYALDTTVPQALNWLVNLFQNLKKCGFEYFKIDFLFAGAIQGKRLENVTPIQAYIQGITTIKKAVGDSFILGCGAPLLPSIGYMDGMRIGPDTAPYWDVSSSDIGYPNAYYSLRNVLTRWFTNGIWWWNDPDCLMLRKSDTQLSDVQRELYTLTSLLLDNMIIQSDNLAYVMDDRLWSIVSEYRKYGRRKVHLSGIMSGQYNITSCGVDGCDSLFITDLEDCVFTYSKDTVDIELIKTVELKDDGRTFNYYNEK
ncbi:MAG TPA: alpha-galactosidase [Fervidobacterium sp.]|nr:alpha-galactosidase [Fervidobacterium sp.]HPT54152.1 alpha-galactosidase [Fervidobacterium sp.]HQE48071.1 alpha-galactosidase [Fervidobacterium sp.]